jgi:hypothetical protein
MGAEGADAVEYLQRRYGMSAEQALPPTSRSANPRKAG